MAYRRPLGLSAYLALVRTGSEDGPFPDLKPDQPTIWCHAASAELARRLVGLCRRIQAARPGVQCVITGTRREMLPKDLPEDIHCTLVPDETHLAINSFLDWLRPALCLWTGNNLRPALISKAHGSGCRLIGLNLSEGAFPTPILRWLPDSSAQILDLFSDLYATSEEALRGLRRLSLRQARPQDKGPLTVSALPLCADETLREEVMEMCGGRPAWLAIHTSKAEVPEVLRAHRTVSRYAHRCLLFLALPDPEQIETALILLKNYGLRYCDWDNGGEIDENTQVVLSCDPEMYGLWYRVAPVAFIGGSLVAGLRGSDPYEAAALGSAILYGPNVGNFLTAYANLTDAGAAKLVKNADSLASCVRETVAPDISATMALAGWHVVSEGAELIDDLVAAALDTIDKTEAQA